MKKEVILVGRTCVTFLDRFFFEIILVQKCSTFYKNLLHRNLCCEMFVEFHREAVKSLFEVS